MINMNVTWNNLEIEQFLIDQMDGSWFFWRALNFEKYWFIANNLDLHMHGYAFTTFEQLQVFSENVTYEVDYSAWAF